MSKTRSRHAKCETGFGAAEAWRKTVGDVLILNERNSHIEVRSDLHRSVLEQPSPPLGTSVRNKLWESIGASRPVNIYISVPTMPAREPFTKNTRNKQNDH